MAESHPAIVRRDVSGVLLLDKPAGLSSTQAMAAAKRIYRAEKAGHTGTLDPFATGLLPICFGEATKFSRFMLDARKSYRATMKLGEVSSTGDTEGVITVRGSVEVDDAKAQAALQRFVGEQLQTPPMYSALKHDGVPLYKWARKGLDVARAPRPITIYAISLVSLAGAELVFDVDVSKGTYIRVLAEDLGAVLGCGAHLTGLRRTRTGGFNLADAHTLVELTEGEEKARDVMLLPPQSLCSGLATQVLREDDATIFCHGGWVGLDHTDPAPDMPGGECAVFDTQGKFLGVGQAAQFPSGVRLSPTRVMAGP